MDTEISVLPSNNTYSPTVIWEASTIIIVLKHVTNSIYLGFMTQLYSQSATASISFGEMKFTNNRIINSEHNQIKTTSKFLIRYLTDIKEEIEKPVLVGKYNGNL